MMLVHPVEMEAHPMQCQALKVFEACPEALLIVQR